MNFLPIDRREMEAAVASLLGEPLRLLVKARLGDMLNGQQSITAADRTERLAALATKRATLERSEERIVREMEATGVDVDRRGDASPEVIFEVSDELAQAGT